MVSQPLSAAGATGLPQLPQPAWQLEVHDPAEHDRIVTCALLQILPHEPQLFGSVAS